MNLTTRKAVNFIVYQVAWFNGVIAAAHDRAALGSTVVAAAVAFHLWHAPRRAPELRLVVAALLAGLAWESLLVSLGLFRYGSGNFVAGLAPYWILALWAQFATTLNLSLAWLKGRALLAATFGAIGGPLAFWAGVRLGALESPNLMAALAAQAFGYAMLVPALCALAQRWNGFAALEAATARDASGQQGLYAPAARPIAAPRNAIGAALSVASESRRA